MDMYCELHFLSEDTYKVNCIKYESPFFLYWRLCFVSTLIPKGTRAVKTGFLTLAGPCPSAVRLILRSKYLSLTHFTALYQEQNQAN